MKTKLTLTDCYKYPNAKIRGYEKGRCVVEYRDITEFLYLKFSCSYRNVDIHERLSKCKLVLKDAFEIIKSIRVPFDDKVIYMSELNPLIDKLRADNFDIDGMKESGRAVYE